MDDWEDRRAALQRNLVVRGTLGVLIDAHHHGLLVFEDALVKLSGTSFYLSDRLVASARRLL